MTLELSYVLPLKWSGDLDRAELTDYLRSLRDVVAEIVVVDGSGPGDFSANEEAWSGWLRHIPPDPDLRFANGKVNGATTGVRAALCEKVALADDDVRYTSAALEELAALLADHDLVRPQNYFQRPLPWHATWDTARSLVNRAVGRDYPGTLGIRRSFFISMGGYDGDLLFENLELIRTVEGAGGRVADPLGLYVARLPPGTTRFLSQRVRQAYDDFALPLRMGLWMSVVPFTAWLLRRRSGRAGAGAAVLGIALAEVGRRRAGGARVYPFAASLLAPAWVLERGVCSWLAVGCRVTGGVRYGGTKMKKAANPRRGRGR